MKNTIRYSSRYTDDETGLLYYGYRYYYPALGKWLSPDPIEESGGMNVFGFLGNDPVNDYDILGQQGGEQNKRWKNKGQPWMDPSKPISDDLTADELREIQEFYRNYGDEDLRNLEFAESATWFAIDIIAGAEGIRAIQAGRVGLAAGIFAKEALVGKAFKVFKYGKKALEVCCDKVKLSFKKVPKTDVNVSGATTLCPNAPRATAPIRNASGGVNFAGHADLYPVQPGQQNIVKIQYTGSRRQDFGAANQEAGIGTTQKPPAGYTWHHLDDYDPATNTGTMQLIKRETHEATYPHNGGVRQYEQATGGVYK